MSARTDCKACGKSTQAAAICSTCFLAVIAGLQQVEPRPFCWRGCEAVLKTCAACASAAEAAVTQVPWYWHTQGG